MGTRKWCLSGEDYLGKSRDNNNKKEDRIFGHCAYKWADRLMRTVEVPFHFFPSKESWVNCGMWCVCWQWLRLMGPTTLTSVWSFVVGSLQWLQWLLGLAAGDQGRHWSWLEPVVCTHLAVGASCRCLFSGSGCCRHTYSGVWEKLLGSPEKLVTGKCRGSHHMVDIASACS